MRITTQAHLRPGESVSDAIKKLHRMGLFYDTKETIGDTTIIHASRTIDLTVPDRSDIPDRSDAPTSHEGSDSNPSWT